MTPNKQADREDRLARLSQEATNQSTPDKALTEQARKRIPKRNIARRRTKPPEG